MREKRKMIAKNIWQIFRCQSEIELQEDCLPKDKFFFSHKPTQFCDPNRWTKNSQEKKSLKHKQLLLILLKCFLIMWKKKMEKETSKKNKIVSSSKHRISVREKNVANKLTRAIYTSKKKHENYLFASNITK